MMDHVARLVDMSNHRMQVVVLFPDRAAARNAQAVWGDYEGRVKFVGSMNYLHLAGYHLPMLIDHSWYEKVLSRFADAKTEEERKDLTCLWHAVLGVVACC